jgi:hypothetical protein
VAKVALSFGCAKQSKNLKMYLMDMPCLGFDESKGFKGGLI